MKYKPWYFFFSGFVPPVFVLLISMFVLSKSSNGQEVGGGLSTSVLLRKEKAFSAHISSNGIGFGFRQGKQNSVSRKTFFEAEITTMKHEKEIRSHNYFTTRSYYYGKLNSMVLLRPGIGIHRIVSEKPYWGGVEVRYFYFAGASVAVLKPVYLIVIKANSAATEYYYAEEPYNPDEHFPDNIMGRGSFTKGFNELKLIAGGYVKGGFHFEFGKDEKIVRSLETGFNIDLYPKHVPLMAFDKNKNIFLTFYISYCFGKRYD